MFGSFGACGSFCQERSGCNNCELSRPHIFTFYKRKDNTGEIICSDCGQAESLCFCELKENKKYKENLRWVNIGD